MSTKLVKPCCVCSSSTGRVLFNIGGKDIYQCENCGLANTSGPLNVTYSNYHWDTDYVKFEKHFKNIFLKRYGIITKFIKKGRMLEIGSSTGTFLNIFKDEGWEVLGIEPSASGSSAKKRGINVINSFFEKTSLKSAHFDLVVLNHTLEHFKYPVIALQKVYGILKKGGFVYVDVPNFGSLSSKLLGKYWPYLQVNEHYYHFSPRSLKKLFEKVGLKVRYVKTRSGIFDYEKPLAGLFEEMITRPKSFLQDLITIPGAYVMTLLNLGTSLTIIAEK